jgi:hypothetical protein
VSPVAAATNTPPGPTTWAGTNLGDRYDPATKQWSRVAMPQQQGVLLAVTGSPSGQIALWFLAEDSQQASLYRTFE